MGTIFTRLATGNSSLSVNGVTIKEIRDESDFPAAVGGEIDLVTNTTYVIIGIVSVTNLISIAAANIAIVGSDREKDGLSYTGSAGAGDFITITDVNCEISNLKISSTNNTGGDVTLRAVNYNAPDYNSGRNKVLTIINCQFRNCFDVWHIEGFDLVDIQNTLVWYIQASAIGCHFKNVSKLQLSSCEYVRWFDETNTSIAAHNPASSYVIGDKVLQLGIFYIAIANNGSGFFDSADWSATGYATTPMIELLDNAGGSGFGAVNISGCVIHPQQTQDGINISNSATIGFGTISSNTGIDIGLSTGLVTNFDYDIQSSIIIQANQKIQNGNAKGTLSIINNIQPLNTGTTNPQVLAVANVNSGAGFTNAPTFPVVNRVITSVANCSFTYNSRIDANFMVIVSGTVEMSGDGFIACRLRNNGTPITHAIGLPEIRQGRAQSFSFSVIGTATFGSTFDVEFESLDTAGASNLNDIVVREFVLNGYQF